MSVTKPATKQIGLHVQAIGMWVVTSVLGFVAFIFILDIVKLLVEEVVLLSGMSAQEGGDYVVVARYISIFAFGIVYGLLVLGGLGYFSQHRGTPRSWRTFRWIMGVELAIIAVWLVLIGPS